jgi:hypothetical protein
MQMEAATFRNWLVEHGCRIDAERHPRGHEGHGEVTVHREGRKAQLPLTGARHALDTRTVHRICDDLGLDATQLPGPQSRV